jgi:FKBP-type peptidyl-prolyl cis-trans isomerase
MALRCLQLVAVAAASAGPAADMRESYFKPPGCAEARHAQTGDSISVHYIGTLADGREFDRSRNKAPFGDPFSIVLGAGAVIKGWEIALVGMCAGEKARLVVPPELGYGSAGQKTAGALADIPPDATLAFDVEMMTIKDPPPPEDEANALTVIMPEFNEEESALANKDVPEAHKCDTCQGMAWQIQHAFDTAIEARADASNRKITESVYNSLLDEICVVRMPKYVIKTINSDKNDKRLSGGGLDADDWPGGMLSNAAWGERMTTFCNLLVGDVGEDDIHEWFVAKKDIREQLCVVESRYCRGWVKKAPPPAEYLMGVAAAKAKAKAEAAKRGNNKNKKKKNKKNKKKAVNKKRPEL